MLALLLDRLCSDLSFALISSLRVSYTFTSHSTVLFLLRCYKTPSPSGFGRNVCVLLGRSPLLLGASVSLPVMSESQMGVPWRGGPSGSDTPGPCGTCALHSLAGCSCFLLRKLCTPQAVRNPDPYSLVQKVFHPRTTAVPPGPLLIS